MSEQSQGPGWWLASDGKWYPPEQAPAAPPPSTEQIGAAPPPGAPPPGAPPAGPPVGSLGGPPGPPPYVPPTPGAPGAPGGPSAPSSNKTPLLVAVIVVAALVAGVAAFALTRGGGSSGGSVKSFCDTAKKFQNDDSLNKTLDDPQKIDKGIAAFDELVKASPTEIKSDMEALDDALKKIGLAVKAAGNDPNKQFAAVLAASAGLDQNKLDQAEKNVEAFGKKNCGADFSFDSSGSGTDSASDSLSSAFSSSFNFSTFSTDSNGSFSFDSDSFSSVIDSASSECERQFGSDFCRGFESSFSSDFSTSS